MAEIPTFGKYMKPVIGALRDLGGSATINELYERVVDNMHLTDEQLAIVHDSDRSDQTEVAYRMAWARTYLKKTGFLTNSKRGVWALTTRGREEEVDPDAVIEQVRASYSIRHRAANGAPLSTTESATSASASIDVPDADSPDVTDTWRQRLNRRLLAMPPDAFERLCQRILRESGFVEVKVLGRTGDGGIDGIGILRLQRMVSFQVLFQSKRWQGTVGAKEIRDFRGAMVGRSDKGLFMTTGTFSRSAQEEATRDGAPPIDLVDGEQLAELLKDLGLGVRTEMIEHVDLDDAWFDGI